MRSIVASACLALLWVPVVSPGTAAAAQERYDLGGPCEDRPSPDPLKEIRDAENARDWDHVVVLEKQSVRTGCNIPYRWYELVNALLRANRSKEASSVLQEMDARGIDVNPALLDAHFSEITKFMESREFGASPLGRKIKRLEAIADKRRVKFQELLSRMPASERPPENYVAKNACPFECCRYGNWTVLEDTVLVSSPGSSRAVGQARKGSRALGLTGEVHLRPEPVIVLAGPDLPHDSIAFILDYLGEGYGHVYTRGKVVETPLEYAKYCLRPSHSCWGEMLWPSQKRKEPVWWVKVRLRNGVEGWSDKPNNFGDKDACG